MSKKRAFTLIELMVVVAIIGTLTSILLPQVGNMMDKTKIIKARAETLSVITAITAYKNDKGYYPGWDPTYSYYYQSASNLNTYLMAPGSFYLQKRLGSDPWNVEYSYHMYLRANPYVDVVFYSNGPDRVNSSWDGNVWLTGSFAGDDIGEMLDSLIN